MRRQLLLDASQHPVAAIEGVGTPGRRNPPADAQVDRRRGEVDQQDVWRGLGQNSCCAAHRVQDDAARQFDVIAVADADVVFEPTMFEGGVDDDRVGEQVRIGNDDPPAVVGADEGRPGLDVFDRAFMGTGDDLIANAEGLRDEEQDSGEEVLEDVTEREADRHAADAKHLDDISWPERR